MGFGLIGHAMAGGMQGAGTAAYGAMGRLADENAKQELLQIQAQIETDRQTALARLQSQLRQGDARAGLQFKKEFDDAERREITDIMGRAQTGAMDEGPVTPGMIRGRQRDALIGSGRLSEAAALDKIDETKTVTTPYGGRTTVLRNGEPTHTIDNSVELRGLNDTTRAQSAGRGRAPKELTTDDFLKIQGDSIKLGERLAFRTDHPFADPTATDKESRKDQAMADTYADYYARAMQNAARNGLAVDPSQVERALRIAGPRANERAIASATEEAGRIFDEKGRLQTGGREALKELGFGQVVTRDQFMRAYRDKYLPVEMKAVMGELRKQAGSRAVPGEGEEGEPADRAGLDSLIDRSSRKYGTQAATDQKDEARPVDPSGANPNPSAASGPVTERANYGPLTPWSMIVDDFASGNAKAGEYMQRYITSRGGLPSNVTAALEKRAKAGDSRAAEILRANRMAALGAQGE